MSGSPWGGFGYSYAGFDGLNIGAATWEERFVPVGRGSKILNYVSYAPESFTLQAVYISGKIVYVHNVSANVRTAMFLASNAEQYVLQLVSVTTP